MAGTAARRELSGRALALAGVRFAVAGPEHDPAIRKLLRENPIPGPIALTLEREPNYFPGSGDGGSEDQTIVAFAGSSLLCVGRCTIRPHWLRGAVRRVGYLSELRLDRAAAGRVQILRSGFAFFSAQQKNNPADFYFTSVAADNSRARELLERGFRGFPRYHFLNEYITRLLPTTALRSKESLPAGFHLERGTPAFLPALLDFLNQHGRKQNLAVYWTEENFRLFKSMGVGLENIHLLFLGDKLAGCAGLWDQRAFRQTVVRGYSRSLQALRPLVNYFAVMRQRIELPAVNATVPLAFLSPFLFTPQAAVAVPHLLAAATRDATTRQVKIAAAGFSAGDARLKFLRQNYAGREYRTRLYDVNFPKIPDPMPASGPGEYSPDAAFL